MTFHEITDLQWQLLEPYFPTPVKRGRGKPHTAWRKVLNSILYVLATGSKWDALPKLPTFASKSASHRWYKVWAANGFLSKVLSKLQELSLLANELEFPATRQRAPKIIQEPLVMA